MIETLMLMSAIVATAASGGGCNGTNIITTHAPDVYVVNRSARRVIYSMLNIDPSPSRWAVSQAEKGQVVYISYALDGNPPVYLSMANKLLISTPKVSPGTHKVTIEVFWARSVIQRAIYCVPVAK